MGFVLLIILLIPLSLSIAGASTEANENHCRAFASMMEGRNRLMLFRMTIVVVILALVAGFSWSQSESTKPATYTLEPVKMSNATYPLHARERKIQGRVVAMMLVSETGDVENVQIFKADAILSQASDETIRQWKFKPVTQNGTAVPVIAKVTFNFVLGNEDQQGITPDVAVPPISRSTLGFRKL
jgi:TonB family protein